MSHTISDRCIFELMLEHFVVTPNYLTLQVHQTAASTQGSDFSDPPPAHISARVSEPSLSASTAPVVDPAHSSVAAVVEVEEVDTAAALVV